MKRLLYILPMLALLATACYDEPFADARITPQPAYVDEMIDFTNLSRYAPRVEWDMDNGDIFTDFNLRYAYDLPGLYNVMLSAYGEKNDVSRAYFTVEVIGDLKIIVKEYYDEYVVPNARVRLYPTLDDWNSETNLVAEAYTNTLGECVFANLNYQRYYVDVFETYHDNYTLASEEGGVQWIETPLLNPEYFYEFIAWVDVYDEPAKKAAVSTVEKKKVLKTDWQGQQREAKERDVKVTPKKK